MRIHGAGLTPNGKSVSPLPSEGQKYRGAAGSTEPQMAAMEAHVLDVVLPRSMSAAVFWTQYRYPRRLHSRRVLH